MKPCAYANLDGSLGWDLPIPGTDFYKWASALNTYLSLNSWQDAAAILDKVDEAYPAAMKAAGTPYIKGTATGEAIVSTISAQTGVSFGRVKAALNVLQSLSAAGSVSASLYNPAQFSLSAKVAQSIQSSAEAIAGVTKKVANTVVPDVLKETAENTFTVLKVLPWLAVAGLGIWAWSEYRAAKGMRSIAGKFLS